MKVGVGYKNQLDAFRSGQLVAQEAMHNGGLAKPDLAIAFCHGRLDHDQFLRGLQAVLDEKVPIVGGSAIGIITNDCLSYEGYPAGAVFLESDAIQSRTAASNHLDQGEGPAGSRLACRLTLQTDDQMLLLFYDSIKAAATESTPPVLNASSPLIAGLYSELPPQLPIIGAGLVGDYQLNPTQQFCGHHVGRQNAVGVMFSGPLIPYYRIMHGCTPLDGVYHTITRMEGNLIYELDHLPVVEMIDELYGGRDWRAQRPVDLLTLGHNHGEALGPFKESEYVNRLITGVLPDGSGIALFEPDFEVGTKVQFMLRDAAQMIASAARNATELMDQVRADGRKALWGLYIDCAGRAAGYSHTMHEEAAEVQNVLNRHQTPLFGFYSGVEIAPLLDQSRGLDWTGVLLVMAEE